MPLAEGQVIDGVWSLVRRLGAGTFGEVWLARHTELGHEMALKIPTDPEFVRQLRTEGVLQFNLRHPNIVLTYDLKTRSDPPFIAMEFVDGKSLRQVLQERGRLPLEEALGLLRQALEALAYAHGKGVLHRDLKPENILLAQDGTVKVADFGLGKVQQEATRSLLLSGRPSVAEGSAVSGTLVYMSPEQHRGAPPSPRDDVHSLGILGCELLAGERPGAVGVAKTLTRVGVAPGMIRVLERACEASALRYADGAAFLEALRQVEGAGRLPSPPVGRGGRARVLAVPPARLPATVREGFPRRGGKRMGSQVALGLGALVLLFLLVVGFLAWKEEQERQRRLEGLKSVIRTLQLLDSKGSR